MTDIGSSESIDIIIINKDLAHKKTPKTFLVSFCPDVKMNLQLMSIKILVTHKRK